MGLEWVCGFGMGLSKRYKLTQSMLGIGPGTRLNDARVAEIPWVAEILRVAELPRVAKFLTSNLDLNS